MKKGCLEYVLLLLICVTILGCAPVIRNDLMETGTRNLSLLDVRLSPDSYKDRVFIFGGIITGIFLTPEGAFVEAQHASVDSEGYLTGDGSGRYLAVLPDKNGKPDPVVYYNGRKMTVAAKFVRMQKGKPDDEFTYPLFEIEQIHLWDEGGAYYYPAAPYWRANSYWWY